MIEQGKALKEILLITVFIIISFMFPANNALCAVRAENSAALDDLRNALAAQDKLYSEYNSYGKSIVGMPPENGVAGGGSLILGPVPAGTLTSEGGFLVSGPPSMWPYTIPPSIALTSIGIAVSEGVLLVSDTVMDIYRVNIGSGYLMLAKHVMGDKVYLASSDTKGRIYVCENVMWIGGNIDAAAPALSGQETDLSGWFCGGYPYPYWIPIP